MEAVSFVTFCSTLLVVAGMVGSFLFCWHGWYFSLFCKSFSDMKVLMMNIVLLGHTGEYGDRIYRFHYPKRSCKQKRTNLRETGRFMEDSFRCTRVFPLLVFSQLARFFSPLYLGCSPRT